MRRLLLLFVLSDGKYMYRNVCVHECGYQKRDRIVNIDWMYSMYCIHANRCINDEEILHAFMTTGI